MKKIIPPQGFKAWYYINASIYAIQLTDDNQEYLLDTLFERFKKGDVADITLTQGSGGSIYNITFREKSNAKALTLSTPNYLVINPDNTLAVLSEEELRVNYTDKLESGVYLDQGAVLRK